MSARYRPAIVTMAGIFVLVFQSFVSAADLPQGFAYLSDIDPTIVQDMRYAGTDNFTRAPVPGYSAAECVLTTDTATALSTVQADLQAQGFGLLVYDCYRPAKAVRYFVEWASRGGPKDKNYFPNVERALLIAQGYIGRRSGHSSGGTIDLTLVKRDEKQSLPMGTSFDFFDPLAHTANRHISAAAKANRKVLIDAMMRGGFRNYKREWWHFRDAREPFAGKVFDFDIAPNTR